MFDNVYCEILKVFENLLFHSIVCSLNVVKNMMKDELRVMKNEINYKSFEY